MLEDSPEGDGDKVVQGKVNAVEAEGDGGDRGRQRRANVARPIDESESYYLGDLRSRPNP